MKEAESAELGRKDFPLAASDVATAILRTLLWFLSTPVHESPFPTDGIISMHVTQSFRNNITR